MEVCSLQPFRQLSCFQPSERECYHLSWRGGKHLFQSGLYLVLSWYREIKGACPAAAPLPYLSQPLLKYFLMKPLFSLHNISSLVQIPPTPRPRVSATPRVRGTVTAARTTVLYCTVLYCTVLYCTALYRYEDCCEDYWAVCRGQGSCRGQCDQVHALWLNTRLAVS